MEMVVAVAHEEILQPRNISENYINDTLFICFMAKINIPRLVGEISRYKRVVAVYLFGSHAKGKATALSDIDICIIAPASTDAEKSEIGGYASEKIDIVFFDELPFTIQWRVLEEGKLLYSRDKRFLADLWSRTFKNYMDFKPIIRKQMREFLPGVEYA